MEDYDRAELLSAMYQDDEVENKASDVSPIDPTGFNRTRRIRVGIVEYQVPTVEYVSRLEQLIAQQARTIEQQKRSIERLEGFVLSTRNFIRRQTSRIQEIQTDLESKVDLREYV
jgi:hypothetical protein